MSNGDLIVGEFKGLARGIVTVETDYTDSDMKLDWDEVRMLRTTTQYLISFAHAENRTGRLFSPDTSAVLVVAEGDRLVSRP